jgi:hypothetical protein
MLVAYNHADLSPCQASDKSCIGRAYSQHKVRNVSFWAKELGKPLSARIGPAPASLVDYLTLGNSVDGIQERPQPTKLDAAFTADLQAAMDEIPADIWRLAMPRLVGIYFVEQLGSTGYADYILGPNGSPSHAFVVLDAGILRALQANAWATWKENTPFKAWAQNAVSLSATIATPENNNRKNAIQYILLHELAHVISVGRNVHPNWDAPVSRPPETGRYPFFDQSWSVDPSKKTYVSRFDMHWPQRNEIRYYRATQLPASDMVPSYQQLVETNFPSLYAATGPGDDFAESLVSYVHTVRMGKPWSITIQRNGQTLLLLESCWEQVRCAQKRKTLEAILAVP